MGQEVAVTLEVDEEDSEADLPVAIFEADEVVLEVDPLEILGVDVVVSVVDLRVALRVDLAVIRLQPRLVDQFFYNCLGLLFFKNVIESVLLNRKKIFSF